MRYDRAHTNLDRYPNYILAAYIGLRYLSQPRVSCGLGRRRYPALPVL